MSSKFKKLLALSATIGTGNIVGVASAIAAGGPGALFWMEAVLLPQHRIPLIRKKPTWYLPSAPGMLPQQLP